MVMTAVNDKKVPRLITPHDKEVAKRLKAIYNRKKSTLGLTQEKLADLTGYTQSTISCHMNGHVALRGLKGIMAYANALEVPPQEIDPRYESRFTKPSSEDEPPPPPVFTLTGEITERKSDILSKCAPSAKCFVLDDEYSPIFSKNTLLVTDKSKAIKKGAMLLVQLGERFALVRMHAITQRSLTYSMPYGFDACRERMIRTRSANKEDINKYYPPDPVKIPLKEIGYMAPVAFIELP